MASVKKAVLMGLGLASLTKERADRAARVLMKRGEAARQGKFKTVDILLKEAEKREAELTKKTTGLVHKTMTDLGLPMKKDLDEVARTLRSVEQKLLSTDGWKNE